MFSIKDTARTSMQITVFATITSKLSPSRSVTEELVALSIIRKFPRVKDYRSQENSTFYHFFYNKKKHL